MAEVEYEPRDVNVRTVVKAAVGLALITAFGAGASFGTYLALRGVYRRHDPKAAPLAPRPGRVPPMPRLQVAPTTDLEQLRAEQLRQLTTYGWIDPMTGRVHIPIEEAMKRYVERAGTAAEPPVAPPAPAASPTAPPAPGSAPQ